MNKIPNICFNEKEITRLLTMNKVTTGGEGVICKGENPYTLYKIFTNYGIPKAMGNNKEKKIIELYNKQLRYMVKPVSTISLNNVTIGYEMIDEYNLDNYKLYQFSNEELIYFLKETKKILEFFTSHGIIYADVAPRNILFNRSTGEIKFCDIDNIEIKGYKVDTIPSSLIEYDEIRGIDSGVHAYMHNLMTLDAYNLDLYCSSKNSLRKILKRKGRKTIDSMLNSLDFNGQYIVTHIR